VFEIATTTMTVTLFDERSTANAVSVKVVSHQLRGKEWCQKSIAGSIRERRASTIWRKVDFVLDFENFNFLPFESLRTREKRDPAQSSVRTYIPPRHGHMVASIAPQRM
jgi:hypothetical protein